MALIETLMSRLRGSTGSNRVPAIFTPNITHLGSWDAWAEAIVENVHKATPAKLFRSQPHLMTVVSFIARNVAQLGLHSFERINDTDRGRDRTSVLAQTLRRVDGQMTSYELIFATVGDLMLYDRAYWFVGSTTDSPTGWVLRRLPPSWVAIEDSTPFEVVSFRVTMSGSEGVVVPAGQILAFPGYSPIDPLRGSSAVEALRATLQEQIEAATYRGQIWKRGGRVSAVLQRPQGAKWSPEARNAFREDWYAKFTGNGPGAGGTPILEDGMTLQRVDFTAQEQQFVEAAKLSLITVASAYHVNPTMIGLNDGANYSNVREFRKMLYGDTLGPTLARIEARINDFLIPMLGMDPNTHYVEFNIAEKLQGNFEEQTQALASAIGRPWMTADEGRARLNLPALGGDAEALVTPLNVLVGGQANPRDSAPKASVPVCRPAIGAKERAPDTYEQKVAQVVSKHFARQERVVRAALGRKSGESWWDADRWDAELGADLFKVAALVATEMGRQSAEALGFDPTDYDEDRTLNWLETVSASQAAGINDTTRQKIADALDALDEEDESGDDPLEQTFAAQAARAVTVAGTAVTTYSAFGTAEAGRQLAPETATKTWITGDNPRPSHAALDGETVGIDELFSNGAKWPGDGAALDADELAGCNCSLDISA